ncbi:transketolase [Candidatus Pacearchaeota archaeon]|nr:transketolase [Candidatus Pacearchaeota archaeon]
MNTIELKEKSKEIRKTLLTSIYESGAGHLGGSLSWIEVCATLFFKQLDLDGNKKDIFILSKGHTVPTLYSALAIRGDIDKSLLKTLRKTESSLEGHPVFGTHPLIHASTGALGQGLSVGLGYAISKKILKKDGRIYVLLGDGECQEGQIWEAAMSASKLVSEDNMSGITAIVDFNKVQGDSFVLDAMPSFHQLKEKWESFGWYVQEVDGHNVEELCDAYTNAEEEKSKPSVIIAHTKKGKGISFMEDDPIKWHGGSLDEETYNNAIAEVERQ